MLRSLPFVPAWLGFVFGAWFVWHYYNTGLKLRAFEETCRVDGLSLDIDALNKLYAAIPVQQNAATVYEQAFTNLVGADTTVIERLATNLVEHTGPPDPEKLHKVELVVARNRKALDLLHAGASYTQCRYSLHLRDHSVAEFPQLDELWTSAQLLALENLDFIANGREDKAVDSITALLALGDSLAKEPFFRSQHYREFCNTIAGAAIEKILNSCALQESELRRLANALSKTEQTTDYSGAYLGNLYQALRADPSKCIDISYRQSPLWGISCKVIVLITDRESADKLYYGNSVRACLKALKNPYPLRLQMMPKSSDEQSYAKSHGYFVSAFFLRWQKTLSLTEAENCARVRVLQTAVAIERYRCAVRGEPPEKLNQLAPRFLPAGAEDPLDGYPLHYRRLKPGYVVYSIGKDMKDDGGLARQPGQKGSDSYDIVTRVER